MNIAQALLGLLQPELLSPLPNGPLPPMAVPEKKNPYEGFTQNIPKEYISLISDIANKSGVDPRLLAAVLFQESKFNSKPKDNITIDEKGVQHRDRGMAQIDATSFPNVTDEQAYNPNFAIQFAANLLANQTKRLGGDINKGVASYNVGVGGVENNLGQNTPFGGGPKGQTYIDNVARNFTPEARKILGLKTRY